MAKKQTYQGLKQELQDILDWFSEVDDIDVEAASAKFERGNQVIKEMQAYLKDAELKVKKV